MGLFDGKTPAERNKTIAALVLGAFAVLFLARMFFGGTPPSKRPQQQPTGGPVRPQSGGGDPSSDGPLPAGLDVPQPLPEIVSASAAGVPDASRNIFAYYVASASTRPAGAALPIVQDIPTPMPTPPPPLLLSGLSPINVFARAGEFKLDVSGDKFTAESRVYIDNQEVPTRVLSAQQLAATVPAALVAAPGARQVLVRTPDGQLYSNTATLNVTPPPTPPFTYVGLLGNPRFSDKALLKQQQGNDLLTVQRGDVVGGRFRVTSISERAVDFADTQLSIKHTLPYVEGRAASSGSPAGPPPRFSAPPQPPPASDDDDDDKDEP